MKYIVSKSSKVGKTRKDGKQVRRNDIFIENLRCAIAKRAVKDYRHEVAKRNPDPYKLTDLENFFLSDYFDLLMLGGIDGKMVISALRKQSNNNKLPPVCAKNVYSTKGYLKGGKLYVRES